MVKRDLVAFLLIGVCAAAAFVPAKTIAFDHAMSDSSTNVTTTPTPFPFEPSEQLVYEGEFSKLLLRGIKIVELRFTANRASRTVAASDTDQSNNSPNVAESFSHFQFTGEAISTGFFPRLFGLNLRYRAESEVESESFNTVRTVTRDEQGRRVRTSEAVFNRTENRVVWTERNPNAPATEEPRVVESPLPAATVHDLISALYYLRTQRLAPGQTFELTISDSGRIYRIPVNVRETGRMRTATLGQVSTIRTEMEIFGDDRLVSGSGRMSVWFTTDARRIPVRARINHDFGTLNLTLKRITNGVAARESTD